LTSNRSSADTDRVRTTLDIDDDVLAAARALAAAEKMSTGKVLSRLARRGLAPRANARRHKGFPVFPVARDAPPLTPDMVRRGAEDD
jgi:hypothetical protein